MKRTFLNKEVEIIKKTKRLPFSFASRVEKEDALVVQGKKLKRH